MLLIFDWDGTLCDSTGRIAHCMQLAAREVGLPVLPTEVIRNIIGLGMVEALTLLYPGIAPSAIQAMREAYSRRYLECDATPSPFFEGVEETLNGLRDEGYTLTIATGKSRRGLDRVLNSMGLKTFFHGSRCADETESKPSPRMLLELMTDFNRVVDEALMVGDTEYDMEMAERAGMARIAVSYGAHEADRLRKYTPLLCVDRFPDILEGIRKLGSMDPK